MHCWLVWIIIITLQNGEQKAVKLLLTSEETCNAAVSLVAQGNFYANLNGLFFGKRQKLVQPFGYHLSFFFPEIVE